MDRWRRRRRLGGRLCQLRVGAKEMGLALQPKMMETMNRDPARLPQKVMNQWSSILQMGKRRCRTDTAVYYYMSDSARRERWLVKLTMNVPVHRSAPVRTISTKPYGKTMAPRRRAGPGAFSWSHGLVLAVKHEAAAKERRHPALTDDRNTLRGCMRPLWTPALETISVTWLGV